jgi:acetolactate synthase I/II/III large subunit
MAKKKVAKQVIEALKELGVKHVFGVPSGGWVDYMEAMRTSGEVEFVLATHEGTGAMMADVYGRLTGVPGVCFGTFGPGATNLTTGVGEALLDRSPMIALTDEMTDAMRGRVSQMGIDHQALFRPITKKTTRLKADKVREIIFAAADEALSGRPGSVHIGLPVGMSALETQPNENAKPKKLKVVSKAAKDKLSKMKKLLASARHPVIALGLGAVRANVGPQISALCKDKNIPVILTPMAKGMIPEDHPAYAGVLFHALSDEVGLTHKDADLIVLVGYDPVEFNIEQWAASTQIVNLDDQPVDIDRKAYKKVLDVVGNIAESVNELCSVAMPAKQWDFVGLAERRTKMFEKLKGNPDVFGPCAVLDVLREVMPQDGIMTCDVGAHTHLIGQKWLTPAPGLQIMTNGWSTMGFGIPAAIAAKICRPNTAVCAVVGDGGFLMSAGELATAMRHNLAFVTVVLSDNDLALIRIKQEKKGNPIYGTPVRNKGTIGGSNIFGVDVLKADNPEDFRNCLQEAFKANKPMIVEAIISSREYDTLVLKKDKAA